MFNINKGDFKNPKIIEPIFYTDKVYCTYSWMIKKEYCNVSSKLNLNSFVSIEKEKYHKLEDFIPDSDLYYLDLKSKKELEINKNCTLYEFDYSKNNPNTYYGTKIYLDKTYVDKILKIHPDIKLKAAHSLSAVVIELNGEDIGVVMPVQYEKINN